MDRFHHSFDARGFKFALKLGATLAAFALFFNLGVNLYYGKSNAYQNSMQPVVKHRDRALIEKTTMESATTSPAAASRRIINSLDIEDVIPTEGKLIVADLKNMQVFLYGDGELLSQFPIISRGKPGTPWDTPSGIYKIKTKEEEHYSTIGHVYMPYSMQFYGNYFIHGRTYCSDGTLTSSSFSGGCIRLDTKDAKKVFEFAELGTDIFVYDPPSKDQPPSMRLMTSKMQNITSSTYLVADLDTGDIFAEKESRLPKPIASITKLMTALVANETISYNKKISISTSQLEQSLDDTEEKTSFPVGDLFYPLLMQSNGAVAESLASYYGKHNFVDWMNATANSLDMSSAVFADASGTSLNNVSSAEDLFRLAGYLYKKKGFILDITHGKEKLIMSEDGSSFLIKNVNAPADTSPFIGGKAGFVPGTRDAMLSVLSLNIGDESRKVVIIVMDSQDRIKDTIYLANWIYRSAQNPLSDTACAACANPKYRRIELPY